MDSPGQFIANTDFLSDKRQFGEISRKFYTYKLNDLPRNFNKPESGPNKIKIEGGIMTVPQYVQFEISLKAAVDDREGR